MAQTHGHLVIETLSTAGLMKTRMARSLADVGWTTFERWLTYKVDWHGGRLTKAPRNFPSTRRCSNCRGLGPKLALHQRQFVCGSCDYTADRDTNAAVNLARYGRAVVRSESPGSPGSP